MPRFSASSFATGPLPSTLDSVKFDLCIAATEQQTADKPAGLRLQADFALDLYGEQQIAELLDRLLGVLETLVTEPDTRVGQLAITSIEEDAALLELGLWVRDGATPWQALVAATRHGSSVCGVGNDLGTIEVGKLADLIVVGGNPLEDIQNVRQLKLVLKEGVIVSDKRE